MYRTAENCVSVAVRSINLSKYLFDAICTTLFVLLCLDFFSNAMQSLMVFVFCRDWFYCASSRTIFCVVGIILLVLVLFCWCLYYFAGVRTILLVLVLI